MDNVIDGLKVKKGLECCINVKHGCDFCPYFTSDMLSTCYKRLNKDCLEYIKDLEKYKIYIDDILSKLNS